jgi:hypothetical protein
MHLVQTINVLNNALLEVREFSYFCCHCIDVASRNYISGGYVEPWRLVTLEPCHSRGALYNVEYDEID